MVKWEKYYRWKIQVEVWDKKELHVEIRVIDIRNLANG